MSSKSNSSSRAIPRSSWLPTVIVAGIGAATGYYWAGPSDGPRTDTHATGATRAAVFVGPSQSDADAAVSPATNPEPAERPRAAKLQRFPLTAADVKDTQGAPDLAVDVRGRLHLVWASITGEGEQTCYLSTSQIGLDGFSEPRALVQSPIAYRSGGAGKRGFPIRMAPHVVAHGDSVSVTWSEKVPDEETVRMVLRQSTDGCATFSDPACVHEHPQARPTFTALAVGPQGELACSWLDGRESSQHPFASLRLAGYAEFAPELKLPGGENGKGVCPCCPTGATFAPDGTLFVGFRNLADGYRDLAIVRLRPGEKQFEGPFAVVPPAWKFDGCPHDGPSLVVAGGALHATWMDAHTGVPRVYYGRASSDDLQFHVAALHEAGPGTQGNAKLYADARGRVHAVWEQSLDHESPAAESGGHQHGPQRTGSGRGICYAVAPAGGTAFQSVRLVRPLTGSFQTRPAISGDGDDQIYVAWCELNEQGKSIVVTSVSGEDELKLTQGASR